MSDIFIYSLSSFLFSVVTWFVSLSRNMTKKLNDFKLVAEKYRFLLLRRRLKNFLFTLFFDSFLLNMMSIDWVNINVQELTECEMIRRKNWFVTEKNFLSNCHLQMLAVHLRKCSFLCILCSFFVSCFCVEKLQVSML